MSAYTEQYNNPHTYVVEGRGPFPFDMLRRDCAWPTDSAAAAAMGETGKRRVTLTAAVMRHIAIDRWESFGWHVVDGFKFGYPCELEAD